MPLTVSIFAYGLVFGVLARQAGLSYWETVTMSAAVFAGSAQFAAAGMIKEGAGADSIVLATLLLNMRHLLMGFSLAPHLGRIKPWKVALLAHFLNDESYALTISRVGNRENKAAYFLGAGLATFLGWLPGSALAAGLGEIVGDPGRYGLDFAFLGVFTSLLVLQLQNKVTLLVFVVTALVVLALAFFVPGNWCIVLGALTAAFVGVVVESYAFRDTAANCRDGRGDLPDEG